LLSFAQTNIVFAYDDSGNRTSRSISVTRVQEKSYVDSTKNDNSTELIDADLSINIFPNPTKGILNVKISGAHDGSKITATLFNMQGNMMYKKKLSEVDEIDISNQPDGIYILKIRVSDSNNNSWKIIKNSQ